MTTLLQVLAHISSLPAVEFLQETLASLNSILLLPHIGNFSLGSGGECQSKKGGGKKEVEQENCNSVWTVHPEFSAMQNQEQNFSKPYSKHISKTFENNVQYGTRR
jgi:hypothetical protein